MTDNDLSLWKQDMPDTNSIIVGEVFGGYFVAINLRSGRIQVEMIDDTETTADDRNDATKWVIDHLKAIRVKADPLEVRDMMWKA